MSPTLTAAASALLGALTGAALTAAATATTLARSRHQLRTLRHQLGHDPLTGLPNRRTFLHRLHTALATTTPVAVAMVDLDRFKTVNDHLGHHAGDHLLRQVADRLRALPPPVQLAARLQGDEFLLLITPADTTAARTAWQAIAHTPFALPHTSHTITVTASIGVALAHPGCDHRQLLHNADLAMYRAKTTHTGVVIAHPHPPQPIPDRPTVRTRDRRPPPPPHHR